MKNFVTLLKDKNVIFFFVLAVGYPLLMLGIFLPSYVHYEHSADDLKVIVYNEDIAYGGDFAEQLVAQLPFGKESAQSMDEALEMLKKGDVALVVHIPADFSEAYGQGMAPTIHYYENGHLSSMSEAQIHEACAYVQGMLTAQLREERLEEILLKQGLSQDEIALITAQVAQPIVHDEVMFYRPQDGVQHLLAPLFLCIAATVFAIMGGAILSGAMRNHSRVVSLKEAWLESKVILLMAGVLTPLAGMGFVYFSGGVYDGMQLLKIWLAVGILAVVNGELILLLERLMGPASSFLATAFLLVQIIAGSGVMATEQTMLFYQGISYISPLKYGIHALKNAMYGGSGYGECLVCLLVIGAVLFVIDCIMIYRKQYWLANGKKVRVKGA